MSGYPLVALPGTRWSLWPDCQLRSAGLPANLIIELSDPLLEEALASGKFSSITDLYSDATTRLTKRLQELAQHPLLREAVTWQNYPARVEVVDKVASPTGKPWARRRREQKLAAYAQRYALKNETIGFFGPVGWARVMPTQPETVRVTPGPGLLRGRTPEAAAISTAYGSTISYQSLDERSDRLTDHLTRLGVGDGSIVAVLLEKGAEALVTFIGIMKASAAYLPLDTTHPAARLSFMVADSSATVLVTVPEFAHLIPEDYAGTVLDIRHLSNGVKAPSGTPRSGQSLDTLAYVIYTSGSTGTPKGVMVTHGGLMNYLEWAGTVYGQHPGTGSLLVGSVAYDMTVPSLFLPLLNGRAVLVPPEPASFDAVADLVRLDEGGIGILKCAPGYLDVLAGFLGQAHVDSVRTYVVGGDALRGDTVRRWRKCAPSARIVNEYGPTETVVGCCIHNVPEVLDHGTPDGAMPIGHAIANTQVYVLDNNLKPVVRGGVGELFIGGVGVARGYLNRPGLTAERFLPDPYGRAGGRLYRTGDLGRVGPEGDLLFLGRADRQVKISGYRVEIEEVESALSSDPAVGECIAVVRHADAGDSLLVGYVTPSSPGQALDAGSVLAEARRSLPAYAVPSRLVSLPELPHMPNGKVDRAALPEFDQLSERQDDRAHGPEADVRAAWSEVLGSANFGAHDHFFDVGGSSLRLMRVINWLSDRYDIDLPMGAMFARPTVADMSARLAEICAGAKHTLANDKMHPA